MPQQELADFWESAACGEAQYLPSLTADGYNFEGAERYRLEPEILAFAEFSRWSGKNVLEIGVGLGADHQRFAEAGAIVTGIDLTERAIGRARHRLEIFGLRSQLQVGDAESLPFPDASFDLAYSWGVIHHTPRTDLAAREILRVLRPGGEFRVMVYNRYSIIGLMLWLRYGHRCGFSLSECYSRFLESPGTKTYTPSQAAELFHGAVNIKTQVVLTHGDLLASDAGQRHRSAVLKITRAIWPRWLLKRFASQRGLFLLVSGQKPLKTA